MHYWKLSLIQKHLGDEKGRVKTKTSIDPPEREREREKLLNDSVKNLAI